MRRVLIVLMFFLSMGTVSAQTGPVLDIQMNEGDGATVFDTSGNGNDGTHYGNTRLLMHFDEGSGTNVTDESAYGNNGTVNGAAWVNGMSGKGLEFDGVDDYVQIDNDLTNGLTSLTLSVWVQSESLDSSNIIRTDGNIIILHYNGAGFYLKADDGTQSNYLGWDSSVPSGQWVHLVATWDGTKMKLYQNGIKQSSELSFDGGTNGRLNSSSFLRVGRYFNSGQSWFNGTIDEVAIYSKALSASEISDLYNAEKATFTDWTDGKVGKALEFDGENDYVEVPDTNKLRLEGQKITLSAWIKTKAQLNDTTGSYPLFINKQNWTTQTGYLFGVYNKDNNRVGIRVLNGNINQEVDYDVSEIWTPNIWHHVVGIYDGQYLRVYIDKIERVNKSIGTFNIAGDTSNLVIGNTQFNGTIDEVRIWNRALSEDEIYWQYHWNEYYPRPVVVPVTATGITGTVLWTGLDQNSGVELSLVSPSGAEYTRDSEGAEARARFIDEVTVTLPVIDYTVTLYNGYKKLKVPATESGKWEFRVRSRNVTDMSVDVGWK